jgi:hypothetical protein
VRTTTSPFRARLLITTDDGILKKYPSTDIRVYNPIDFLVEVENA